MRPNALALSPDGKLLVTAGLTHELVVVDPATGKILQRVPFPSDTDARGKTGGRRNFEPGRKGAIEFHRPDVFAGRLADLSFERQRRHQSFRRRQRPENFAAVFHRLAAGQRAGRKEEIPAGIAVSRDGKKIYVAGNLSNRLLELDAATGKVLRTWDVGVAPFDVVLGENKIYVSNWGGRRPDADSVTGPTGEGTRVRVDERSIASEGSVSVIDLQRCIP